MEQTLFLNWVYYYPVGHAVEALKVAKGYHSANRKMKVSVLLNAETPVELAEACPWITRAYANEREWAKRYASLPPLSPRSALRCLPGRARWVRHRPLVTACVDPDRRRVHCAFDASISLTEKDTTT